MGDQAYSVLVVLPFGTPDAVLRPAEIPPLLAEAIVATEDERFCQHDGFIVLWLPDPEARSRQPRTDGASSAASRDRVGLRVSAKRAPGGPGSRRSRRFRAASTAAATNLLKVGEFEERLAALESIADTGRATPPEPLFPEGEA
jgi:Transglycosylase